MTAAIEGALAGEATAIALCWKLTRADGVILGFTGHDRDLRRDGLLFRAKPGMTPSAVSLRDGYSADSMDVAGVLDASAISADDLDAGRWTGAQLELLACDWTAPEVEMLRLMRGTIGDVVRAMDGADGAFRVELVSDMARLAAAGAPRCSPLCRADLGDARCGVDMDARRIQMLAVGGTGAEIVLEEAVPRPGDYAHGRLRIVTGRLAGLDRRIARVAGSVVTVEEPIWSEGVAGAQLWIWEGCDKRFETCSTRFANAAAFDGEPHVPGTDALVRYGEI